MNTRTITTASAIGLIALALSACGGSSAADDAPASVPADVGLEVDAGPGIKWGSETYSAAAGDVTVALVNRDSQKHSLVFVDADRKTLPGELVVAASGDIDVKDFSFDPGTYQLLCLVPGHDGMKATLEVG